METTNNKVAEIIIQPFSIISLIRILLELGSIAL